MILRLKRFVKDLESKMPNYIYKDGVISREELFRRKEEFHREQARLPFEEKIEILVKLQKIAAEIKHDPSLVWKI